MAHRPIEAGDGGPPPAAQPQAPKVGWNLHTVAHVLKETASDRAVRMVVGAILITGVTYGVGAALKEYADYESMWNALASTAAVAAISSGLTTAFLISVLLNIRPSLEKMNVEQRAQGVRTLYYNSDVQELINAGAQVMVLVSTSPNKYKPVANARHSLSDDGKFHRYVLMFSPRMVEDARCLNMVRKFGGPQLEKGFYELPGKIEIGSFLHLAVVKERPTSFGSERAGDLPEEEVLDVLNRIDR